MIVDYLCKLYENTCKYAVIKLLHLETFKDYNEKTQSNVNISY